MPETIGLGDVVELAYTLRSEWPWPVSRRTVRRAAVGTSRAAIPRRRSCWPLRRANDRRRRVTGRRAGDNSLGDVALRVHDAARLARTRLVRGPSAMTVVVVPSLTNVRRFRLLAMQHRLSDAGIRALKQRGEGTRSPDCGTTFPATIRAWSIGRRRRDIAADHAASRRSNDRRPSFRSSTAGAR